MAGLNTRADIPAWDSITDGTTLYKGGYVTRAGRYWLCMEKHTKTAQTAPSYESPLWLDALLASGLYSIHSSPETANQIRHGLQPLDMRGFSIAQKEVDIDWKPKR